MSIVEEVEDLMINGEPKVPFNPSDSDYNNETVTYCSRCLSLAIVNVEDPMRFGFSCFCDNCTSTDTEESSIFEWEEKFKARYNRPYILKTKNKEKSWERKLERLSKLRKQNKV